MGLESLLKTGIVSALGEPEAFGHMSESGEEGLDSQFHLCVDGCGILLVQRQESVRCGCGYQFEMSACLKAFEPFKDIAPVKIIEIGKVLF